MSESLPVEAVGSWVTEPDAHWFGRCDGCGKRRIRLDLYDCFPERFMEEGGSFYWQCAGCMIESLSAKLEAAAPQVIMDESDDLEELFRRNPLKEEGT